MLTACVPFQDDDDINVNRKIVEADYQIPDFVNFKARDLIQKVKFHNEIKFFLKQLLFRFFKLNQKKD